MAPAGIAGSKRETLNDVCGGLHGGHEKNKCEAVGDAVESVASPLQ
jgi:hypothetical protein